MDRAPVANESEAAKAVRELSQLNEQTAAARASLIRLQQEVIDAESRLIARAAELVGANERLARAMLRVHASAETDADEQRAVVQSSDHGFLQAQLQEANERLVLAALGARELQVAAEHALRSQTEFLAVLAHELRNPLGPIRTAAAMLGRIPAEQLPHVKALIERQVTHMSRLIGDLLDVSRVNTGRLRLESRKVDVAALIDEVVEGCRPAMDKRLQRFHALAPARGLEIQGDPVRLAQVLSNLLDNASKYTPAGGEITLLVKAVDDDLSVTVSDNGIGIRAEALPNIFKPFVQDAQAIGFDGTGLGIGLTVVRALVEAHGGGIVASSAGSGLGSEFVVTIPLLRPASP